MRWRGEVPKTKEIYKSSEDDHEQFMQWNDREGPGLELDLLLISRMDISEWRGGISKIDSYSHKHLFHHVIHTHVDSDDMKEIQVAF